MVIKTYNDRGGFKIQFSPCSVKIQAVVEIIMAVSNAVPFFYRSDFGKLRR